LSTHSPNTHTTDIQTRCWFDRVLPPTAQPYTRLARWDRPIGFWLLFWPCLWGLFLSPAFNQHALTQHAIWIAAFFIGSVAMRGAGCTINDMWDRKLDAQVTRTAGRPLASGAVSLRGAFIFLGLQCLVGLLVLLILPLPAQLAALLYIPLIIIYPLMKRITMWPQAFLALVFNAGAVVGWLATGAALSPVLLLLYITCMVWTLGYDTIYAHMDQRDDAMIGIKSTVIHFGEHASHLVGWCFLFTAIGWIILANLYHFSFFSIVMLAASLFFQCIRFVVWKPENDAMSLNYFRYQHGFAAMIALACWYNALNNMAITG
jgi:4-hydroxybenzoate polyprenyltransferase